jgi:hypothetical protein
MGKVKEMYMEMIERERYEVLLNHESGDEDYQYELYKQTVNDNWNQHLMEQQAEYEQMLADKY